jgi:hypothetical protein
MRDQHMSVALSTAATMFPVERSVIAPFTGRESRLHGPSLPLPNDLPHYQALVQELAEGVGTHPFQRKLLTIKHRSTRDV